MSTGNELSVALVYEPVSSRMGAERVVLKTQKYLARAGHRVHVVDPRKDRESLSSFQIIHVFGTGSDMAASLDLVRKAKACGKACLLSTTLWPFTEDALAKAFEGLSLEPASAFGLVSEIIKSQIPQIKLIELVDVVIVTSEIHLERVNEVLKFYGREELRDAAIVPNAVDPEEFVGLPNIPWEERANHVVTLARVELWKNHVRLVKALEAVRETIPDLSATFAGRTLLSISKRDWLDIVNEVSPRLGHLLLALSKVHAMPSLGDFPGLAHLEAAAMGCQVVGSRPPFTTLQEYLPDAILVDPTNVGSIAEGIRQALERPPERLRERVLENYTFSKVAERLSALYKELV